MDVAGLLKLPILKGARVVASGDYLSREVKVVAAVDHPQPLPFVRASQLLLTTGYAWPRTQYEQRLLIRGLAGRGVSAIGVAVPQYIDRVPRPARDEAERHHVPVVEIPWEIPFSSLTLDLNSAIIGEQYEVIERQLHAIQQSERIHRTVTRAAMALGSLEDLAASLGSLLDRDVAFEGPQGQVLGVFGCGRPRRAAERELDAARAEADRRGLRDLGRARAGAVRVAAPDVGAGGCLLCPIHVHDGVEGWVWIWGGDAPIGDLEARASEHAALVAGLTIAHQRSLAQTEAQLGYTFVDSLLEGRAGAPGGNDILLERARLQGFRTDGRYRVALMALDVPQPLKADDLALRERLIADLRLLLERQGSVPLMSPSTSHIRLLLAEGVSAQRLWDRITSEPTLAWSRRKHMLALVVGRLAAGPEGIRQAYREILTVVSSLRFGELQHVEGALVLAALQGDVSARELLVQETFGPVEERPELCRTLEALARAGFQQRVAADALGVHVNTLRYRIARLEELTGLSLSGAEDRFRVQLACRARLLISDKPGGADL